MFVFFYSKISSGYFLLFKNSTRLVRNIKKPRTIFLDFEPLGQYKAVSQVIVQKKNQLIQRNTTESMLPLRSLEKKTYR